MLVYGRVCLRALAREDADLIVKWRNDHEVMRGMQCPIPPTKDQHIKWYEKLQETEERIEFVIVIIEGGVPIGTVGLSHIDIRNQNAEYGILIGDKEFRERGYAKEASVALLNYAFYELNLWKVQLRVLQYLDKAITLYDRLGFKKDGVLRDEIFKGGQFQDVVNMSLLREEWDAIAPSLRGNLKR